MKKRRILSVLVAFFILFGSFQTVFVSDVHAEESASTTSQVPSYIGDSYLANYYYRLTNFGYNSVGTCGYIALAMLLAYYDCYWDDTLVADSYMASNSLNSQIMTQAYSTCNSPGATERISLLLNETYKLRYQINDSTVWADYLNCSNQYVGTSLQSHLINVFQTEIRVTSDGGIKHYEIDDLLEKYLVNRDTTSTIYSADDWEIETQDYEIYLNSFFDGEELREGVNPEDILLPDEYSDYWLNSVKAYLQDGYPVLMTVTLYSTTGQDPQQHTVVAYAYDEQYDKIYVHSGWQNKPCISMDQIAEEAEITDMYECLHGFLVLRPTGQHVHSNNYYFSDHTSGVCSCQLPYHEHEYVYQPNGTSGHTGTCYCGNTFVEQHSYMAQGLTQKVCYYCGHTQIISPDTPVVRPLDSLLPIVPNNEITEEERE